MTPARFITKWSRVTLPERAASQEHFIDLCRLLGQPTPAEHDATGAEYTFEKGVSVTSGASRGAKGHSGYADAWWRGKFAWEYKRKDKYKDLADAYRQLCQYREALDNPPLLIVSDISRTEIHTNFTGTAKQVHLVLLEHLDSPESLSLLRRAFTNPESFRPTVTAEKVTEEVAKSIATLAGTLQARGHDPHSAAHFLMKCMFCFFAEDVNLLPEKLFSRLLSQWHDQPAELTARVTELFDKMRTGGAFGAERIAWFNGGLFALSPALPLEYDEIGLLRIAAKQDWGSVEPAIFGTLFERSLDPTKRAQIGAHYTSRNDIMLIVEPVVMAPLRKEWQRIQQQVEDQLRRRRAVKTSQTKRKANQAINDLLEGFLNRLASLRILDPACGSGNFLYVAIQLLLDLEKEVVTFAAGGDIGLGLFPTVRPTQVHGIESNPYAAELSQVVIWIGYLQWMRDNGFNSPRDPILEPLATIECRDAILAWVHEEGQLIEVRREGAICKGPAAWPQADFIIGNPPFLGNKLLRSGLGDEYVNCLYSAFSESVPNGVDLCCYWFELARRALASKPAPRCGLLATQGIRGRTNRTVLEAVKQSGDIFMAWSDREWVLDGANVRVSMVGFDSGAEASKHLDGREVMSIDAALTPSTGCSAKPLLEMTGLSFQGPVKVGAFEIGWEVARQMLAAPAGPGGEPNRLVLRPWRNGQSITRRWDGFWIIDFALMPMNAACRFVEPFEYVVKHVKPEREKNRRKGRRDTWWLWGEPNRNMRRLIAPLQRYIVTCQTAKHRMWAWFSNAEIAAQTVIGVARSDDYFFGVLQSALHELWALRMGTQLEDRPRYTPTTCFETFPLPWAPGKEPSDNPVHQQISVATKDLDEMRHRWLNPPEWIEPIAQAIDAKDDFADVPAEARPLIRQSAIMAAAAKDPNLKKRTLTKLYNERPTWLKLAHRKLDEAVLGAYAQVDPEAQWSLAWAEVWQDSGAGQPLPAGHPLAAERADVDQKVLANLLRLNMARSATT